MPHNAVQAKKKFGQNFLVSQFHLDLLEKELNIFVQLTNPIKVLEIGPGAAALTKIILSNFEGEVEAWEIDPEAVEYLSQTFNQGRLNLIQRDALAYLEEVLNGKHIYPEQDQPYSLISNLPYNVGSRILVNITCLEQPPQGFLVMLQKEVGDKLVLKEKNMNLLGAFLNLFWDIKLVGKFPRSAFSPQPNVESVLVRAILKPKMGPAIVAVECLFLLKNLLKYPNKTLTNNLGNLGWGQDKINDFMQQNHFPHNTRLTTSNYLQILVLIHQYKG